MAIFDEAAKAYFVARLAEYVRERHGSAIVRLPSGKCASNTLPDETLKAMVSIAIRRAQTYEILWQAALTAFVVIALLAAPNFDEAPLVLDLLNAPDFSRTKRIDALCTWLQTEHVHLKVRCPSPDYRRPRAAGPECSPESRTAPWRPPQSW